MTDAAIHRVSGDAGRNSGLFPCTSFTLQSSLLHFLANSGSPRASSSRLYLLGKASLLFIKVTLKNGHIVDQPLNLH